MTLSIGRRFRAEVESLEEASREYQLQRDESGQSAEVFPEGRVTRGYRISYNGRVWHGPRMAATLVMNAAPLEQ
jgi:hypothetical protein